MNPNSVLAVGQGSGLHQWNDEHPHRGESMNAVITGAGSGVGQATALAFAELGRNVAIIGRRKLTLNETL